MQGNVGGVWVTSGYNDRYSKIVAVASLHLDPTLKKRSQPGIIIDVQWYQ